MVSHRAAFLTACEEMGTGNSPHGNSSAPVGGWAADWSITVTGCPSGKASSLSNSMIVP
jgi:hypothetical protein